MLLKIILAKILNKKTISAKDLVKFGVLTGFLEIVYIALVAGFVIMSELFLPDGPKPVIIGIMTFLTLFVFSAGISGVLVFGLPFYLALQNKYREALITLLFTGLALIVVLVLIILGAILI